MHRVLTNAKMWQVDAEKRDFRRETLGVQRQESTAMMNLATAASEGAQLPNFGEQLQHETEITKHNIALESGSHLSAFWRKHYEAGLTAGIHEQAWLCELLEWRTQEPVVDACHACKS